MLPQFTDIDNQRLNVTKYMRFHNAISYDQI